MSENLITDIFNKQKAHRFQVAASTAHERIAVLKRIQQYLLDHVTEACEATYNDFQKPQAETIIGELLVLQNELSYAIKHLKRWAAPQKQQTPLVAIGTTSYVQYEPKGCALIISPWNYPICLAFKPLISAIAAGCTVIIKPSEMAPHSSAFVSAAVKTLFDDSYVAVIEGDESVSTALLSLPFDHIFFTGSPAVGKIVMKAASEFLTSVTLELGGKSPSIVDETADIKTAASQIAWGKFFNNGQTCIAPDYVLVHEKVHEAFISEIKKVLILMYGVSAESSESYGRIVSDRHFSRLNNLLADALSKGAVIEAGGETNPTERFIAPTIVSNANASMLLIQQEIFGPLLPVLRYKTIQEAVDYVNRKEKPLALYVHSASRKNASFILDSTSAGNALVNEVLTQFGNPEIPFGGVNHSGIGKSNGFYGFQEFSNPKGVMKRRFGTMRFLYPPYSERVVGLLKKVLRYI
jgi:aldehyde dehydrogenase (NAD+)